MTFQLPKSGIGARLASAVYEFLMPITLEVTKVERILVQVLERIVKEGRTSPPRSGSVDEVKLKSLVETLSTNSNLENFDSEQGRSLLTGWLRAAVVEMIYSSKSETGEQMDFLKPITVASYRSGLPRERQKHRKIDQIVYRSMLTYWLENPGATAETLRAAVIENSTLGEGVDFKPAQYPFVNPEYSGKTKVDINALLELRFLEGVTGRNPSDAKDGNANSAPLDPAVPSATIPVGKAMVDFMLAYKNWSALEITTSLGCIVALFMYQMPIRTGLAVRELLEEGGNQNLLSDTENNPMQMYFDFTNNPASASSALSKASVSRDLTILSNFFLDLILLRETESAARATQYREELDSLDGVNRLVKIASLIPNESVEIACGLRLNELESDLSKQEEEAEQLSEFRVIRDSSKSNLEALVKLIVEDRRSTALSSIRKAASSLGGLTKDGPRRSHALLAGTMAATTTWKYSMSEPMLLTLVNLCFLDNKGNKPTSPALEIRVLLDRLERRFGILIHKVPSGLESPEAKQAASDNFVHFIARLKTLGYFKGLSDDFSAQFIERPEAGN